jgi:hypothetical protein
LNTTQIAIIRTKNGISKFNWLQGNGFDTRTEYYINTSINTGSPITPSSPIKLIIGSYIDTPLSNKFAGAYPMEGYFCEMLYYNRYLKTSEINALEQYLKMKWIG